MSSPELPPELEEVCAVDSWRQFKEDQELVHNLLREDFGMTSDHAWLMLMLMDMTTTLRMLLEAATGSDEDYGN